MCRELIYLIIFVLLLAANTQLQASVFSDGFETPHDYIADGVTGTGWDGFLGLNPGETVDALNTSTDRAGQLYMESTGAFYHEPWDPLGPFLYKIVKGDFVATVKVSDYAGTAEVPVYHNNCGLMARAEVDEGGAGEDWVAIDYFPIWGCGNFVRTSDNDARTENCNNGAQWDLDPYLQLERKGNTFHFRTSADGLSWVEMACSPITRDDLDGLSLQVGLYQATYSGDPGYAAFDDFSCGPRIKAHNPVPADGSIHTDTWANLSWSAGGYAVSHNVYFGENFDDVDAGAESTFQGNQAATFFVVGFQGFPFPEGLVPGTTYYWRIDEINDVHPESPWKGNIWSFTVPSKKAYRPSPPDGAEFVDQNTQLSWMAGYGAKLHTVYFGDNFEDVNTAAGGPSQADTRYAPDPLDFDKTYYWRVDEFDAVNTYKGNVWSFKTMPVITVTDPNLFGWWKFDEGYGTKALDWSGRGNHASLMGDPDWVVGYDGEALELDGADDYVLLPIGPVIESVTSSSFTIWVNFSNAGGAWQRIFDFGSDTTVNMFLTPRTGSNGPMRFAITTGGSGAEEQATAPDTLPGGWHHVAVTINANIRTIVLYLDGEIVARTTAAALTPHDLGITGNNWLGRSQYAADAYFRGSLDDFRIYNYALSQDEVKDTMRGDLTLAWKPGPIDKSTPDIHEATPLSWSPGNKASQHDVYFGTDEDGVNNADVSDTTSIYRGRQDTTSYTPPEGVEWGGGPYYWRIDEYNTDTTISKGKVWSFTVADYLNVDDFEDYDAGENQIWYAWKDGLGYGTAGTEPYYPGNGTGSAVGDETTPSYTEETIVHGGSQAMPLAYDNNKQGFLKYSEAEMTLTYPRDWTENGVRTLTIWFRGDSDNAAEPLYVALNGSAVVTNDNPDAALTTDWTQWNIDLQAFADQGLNLANVNTIALGLGNKNNPQPGGLGTMYFDDIHLYRPAP